MDDYIIGRLKRRPTMNGLARQCCVWLNLGVGVGVGMGVLRGVLVLWFCDVFVSSLTVGIIVIVHLRPYHPVPAIGETRTFSPPTTFICAKHFPKIFNGTIKYYW